MNISKIIKNSLRASALLKVSLICISTLALSGCMALTLVSGVVGGVDSVAKEIKINKLKQIQERRQSLNLTFHLIKTWGYKEKGWT